MFFDAFTFIKACARMLTHSAANCLEIGPDISRVLNDIMAEKQSISGMNGYDNEEDQMVGCISA